MEVLETFCDDRYAGSSSSIRLDNFDNGGFQRGQGRVIELLWIVAQAMVLRSFVPGSIQRRVILRLFGARIGRGVVVKPGVRVKFPWRLVIGEHSWIGEDVWIDNLAQVTIGAHCCVSQSAYICTGSHDWSKPSFDLIAKPIEILDGSWIAAKAIVAPGAIVGRGAVVTLGSVAQGKLEPWCIHQGIPAVRLKDRAFTDIGSRHSKKEHFDK